MPDPTPPALRLCCPACKKTYRIQNPQTGKYYACQFCKGPLSALPEAPLSTIGPARPAPALALAPTVIALQNELELQPTSAARKDEPDDALLRMLPPLIDDCKIIRQLARGGMGAVLLGEQQSLRRKVAIKVMLPSAEADMGKERFVREARAMAKLRHPGIIEVHHVGTVNALPYFVMEFVEGENLDTALWRQEIEPRRVAEIIAKTARALAFAHAQGVVHRDIKPANIMLRPNGDPVVMDFGLAKDFDSNSVKLSMTGNIMGTPAYMSPEQAQGLPADARSDVCSLAIVLYEALTHSAPYQGKTTVMTMYNVVHTEPEPAHKVNSEVPHSLANICAKGMEKDPAQRYQSMAEFAQDLERFLAGAQVEAKAPSLTVCAIKFARRRKTLVSSIAAGCGVLLLIIVALQAGWLRTGKSQGLEIRKQILSGEPEARLLHIGAISADLKSGKYAPASAEHAEALTALREATADVDTRIAIEAIRSLSAQQDNKSLPVLEGQLKVERPIPIRCAALAALGTIRPQGAPAVIFKALQDDPAVEVKLAALAALGEVPDPAALTYLLRLAARGEPAAVASAARAKLKTVRSPESILALYTGTQAAAVARTAGAMLQQTSDYERQLEEALAETRPEHKQARRAEPYELAAQKLRSGKVEERLTAAYDLAILGDARAEPDLLSALKDTEGDVALAAAESLGKLPALKETQRLAELLKHNNPATRQAAARACGLVQPAPDAMALQQALIQEKQPAVQAELAQALGRLRHKPALPALLTVLKEGSPGAQLKAAKAVGSLGDKSACSDLVEALARASKDAELQQELAAALSVLTGKTIGPDIQKWREALKHH